MSSPPDPKWLDAIPKRPLVGGEPVAGTGTRSVVDPATGETFCQVETGDAARTQQAIEQATACFGSWRKEPGKQRARALRALAEQLAARADDLADCIVRENGKPRAQAAGEVALAIDHLEWFAEEARRLYGRVVPSQFPGKRHWVLRQPVGVVGAIAPWNFPLMLAVRKIAPAVAAGCPVVLKPASATPLSSLFLGALVREADWPDGLLQVIPGPADSVTEPFFRDARVRKVTFTGSTAVGRLLIARAADSIQKLSLELGGHAPGIVFEDADLPRTIEQLLIAKFRNTGQSCIAVNRIYVQASVYNEFREAFVAAAAALPIGPGWEPGVEIGPLIDADAVASAEAQVADAVDRGATIACGGRRLDRRGFFFPPTVLTGVPRDAACLAEESFAPLVPLEPFDTEREAIERANDTPYGLAAYLFTENLGRAIRVAEALEAGTIGLNDGLPTTSLCPFGGMKQSGWGRELGSEGVDAFLETKHVAVGGIGG